MQWAIRIGGGGVGGEEQDAKAAPIVTDSRITSIKLVAARAPFLSFSVAKNSSCE